LREGKGATFSPFPKRRWARERVPVRTEDVLVLEESRPLDKLVDELAQGKPLDPIER